MKLTPKEKEILNYIVQAWDESDALLTGSISYAEVFKLLDKLGLKRPKKLTAFIKALKKL